MFWNRRIYYDLVSGEPILVTGGFPSIFERYTVEYEISIFKKLNERLLSSFGFLDLAPGQYDRDFEVANGYRINPETKKLEFSYPTPGEPEAPNIYGKPLSEEVKDVRLEMARGNAELFETMIMLNGGGM